MSGTNEAVPFEFLFILPGWVLATSASGNQRESVDLADPDILFVHSPAQNIIPIFTDRAWAEEFAKGIKVIAPIFIKVSSLEELAKFIKRAKRFGYENVTIDPKEGFHFRSHSLDELFQAASASKEESE
jgi:hypothetical protein